LGILADLIATNRKLLEANMLKLRRIEEKLTEAENRTMRTQSQIANAAVLDTSHRKAY
jgi:hypothetical protein